MMYNRYPQQLPSRALGAPGLLGQVLGITGVGFLITALAAYVFRGDLPFGRDDRVLRPASS